MSRVTEQRLFSMITFVRFIYPLLIFYCCLNKRKEVAAISFFCLCVSVCVCFCVCVCIDRSWSVASSCHIVGNLCPDWRSWLARPSPSPQLQRPSNPLAHPLPLPFPRHSRCTRKRKRNRQSSGRKKGDIAASAQQSCRSIHQKMETNFLSVVVSPVDVIVLLLVAVAVALRLLRLFFLLFILTGFFMPFLFYCCSIFYLAFLLIFCCLTLVAIQWSENGAACT